MPAPNLKTVSVFGIVAISTQLIVFPFRKVLFFCKSTYPRHGLADPKALVPFLLLLGSTSCIPALEYSSDHHVTVISDMSLWFRVISALRLSCDLRSVIRTCTGNFIWIIIEININPVGIINNNLILPVFCRALIY